MSIADNIKLLREQHGLSQHELGEIAGVTDKAVSTWELGLKTPRMGAIEKLSQHFNIPKSRIIDDSIPKGMERYNPVMYKIPILGKIAAGLPTFADENIEDYTYTEHNGGAEYFALRVKGDSMNALSIKNGSIIIVRQQPQVENGEVAVVRVNDDSATVKCFKQEGRMVYLIPRSYDPKYEVQIYDLKRDRIEIIGKVVECKIEF